MKLQLKTEEPVFSDEAKYRGTRSTEVDSELNLETGVRDSPTSWKNFRSSLSKGKVCLDAYRSLLLRTCQCSIATQAILGW
jgi:hypothetical protein